MTNANITFNPLEECTDPISDEPLVKAVENSDIETVSDILKHGGNINAVSLYGFPVLVIAAKNNDLPMVIKLLEYFPKTEATDCYGRCALVWSIMNKNPELYSVLLKAHTDINHPNNILVFAIAYGEHELARYILPRITDVNSGWIAGKNPLMWAVELGADDLVSDILMKGPVITNLNYTDNENFGDPKIEQSMMELFKNYDQEFKKSKQQENIKKVSVYKFCEQHRMINAYKALFDNLEERMYTIDNIKEKITELLQAGLKIDVKNSSGRTPISLFCSNERGVFYLEQDKKIFEMFMIAGSDINSTDNNQNTPLHHAVNEQYLNMIRILVKKGADINKINKYGYTPKDIALLIYPNNKEAYELFADKKKNIK